jgi:hypothetical protein
MGIDIVSAYGKQLRAMLQSQLCSRTLRTSVMRSCPLNLTITPFRKEFKSHILHAPFANHLADTDRSSEYLTLLLVY